MEQLAHSASKASRKLSKELKKKLKAIWPKSKSFVLILCGTILFSFGAYRYFSTRILSFSKAPPETITTVKRAELPARITIEDLKIDLPMEEGFIKNGVWQISDTSASHLNTSARPGEGGNIVIYGHNKKIIFGSLPFARIGAKIVVTDKTGKKYNYEVTSKDNVSPDRVDLLYPTSSEELTIYTCTGLFDSQRFILKAKQI